MKRLISKKNGYLLILGLILFCVYQYGIRRIYGFSLYPDEFGYWANAAKILGYDWSKITSLGSYYSFGYGLILLPILYFANEAIAAYRIAVTVNVVLVFGCIWLIDNILRELFPEEKKIMRSISVGIAVFYPGVILYMQMTLTETLLMFLFVLICYFFIKFYKEPRMLWACFLSVALVYIFLVHMRTVAVLIAGVITLLLLYWKIPRFRRKVVLSMVIMAVLFSLGVLLKNQVAQSVFSNAGISLVAGNDFSGQWGTFQRIVSSEGILTFLAGCVGKLFYLIMATFGLFYWGMKYLWKNCILLIQSLKSGNEIQRQELISFFLFLSVIGQFLISAIYMSNPRRIDGIVYGRYNEFLLPLIISLGVIELFRSKSIWKETLILIIGAACSVPIIEWIVIRNNLTSVHGYFMSGISYLMKGESLGSDMYFWKAYAFGVGIMILISLFAKMCKKYLQYSFLFSLVILMEIGLGLFLSEKYTYRYTYVYYADTKVFEEVMLDIADEIPIYYLNEDGRIFISSLQFMLGGRNIQVISKEEADTIQTEEEHLLITNNPSKYEEEIEAWYINNIKSPSFLYYYDN